MRASGGLAAAAITACTAGLVACGGGARQDAGEPGGSFRLEVVRASFPGRQALADSSSLVITVRNADAKAVPDVAVTIGTATRGDSSGQAAFATAIEDTAAADRSRPIWIVDRGPRGGDTAYTNTWALGRLAPGASRRFVWHLTAVRAGRYRIRYTLSPGLTGKATVAGNRGKGSLRVRIGARAPNARVDDAGNVVRRAR